MFKSIDFHFKEFFFYIGLLIGFFFLTHNLLLIKHYQLERKIVAMKKKFQELSIEERKLRSQRDIEINKLFEESRSRLKKYSIKNIPLIRFE